MIIDFSNEEENIRLGNTATVYFPSPDLTYRNASAIRNIIRPAEVSIKFKSATANIFDFYNKMVEGYIIENIQFLLPPKVTYRPWIIANELNHFVIEIIAFSCYEEHPQSVVIPRVRVVSVNEDGTVEIESIPIIGDMC